MGCSAAAWHAVRFLTNAALAKPGRLVQRRNQIPGFVPASSYIFCKTAQGYAGRRTSQPLGALLPLLASPLPLVHTSSIRLNAAVAATARKLSKQPMTALLMLAANCPSSR